MRTLLIVALSALVWASPVLAQDRIELYADASRASCEIAEPTSPPIVQVHVFVTGTMAVNGARFTAPKPDCWVGATWLGDALAPGVGGLGNSQSDWSLAWYLGMGGCNAGNTPPTRIAAISYLISGQALPCCTVTASPSVQFVFTDCNFAEHELGETKPLVINPDASCGCHSSITTAVEPTSWGRVKALYR
jgi:hypothetical protein